MSEEHRNEQDFLGEVTLPAGALTAAAFDALVTPEVVCRLGSPQSNKNPEN